MLAISHFLCTSVATFIQVFKKFEMNNNSDWVD